VHSRKSVGWMSGWMDDCEIDDGRAKETADGRPTVPIRGYSRKPKRNFFQVFLSMYIKYYPLYLY